MLTVGRQRLDLFFFKYRRRIDHTKCGQLNCFVDSEMLALVWEMKEPFVGAVKVSKKCRRLKTTPYFTKVQYLAVKVLDSLNYFRLESG